MTIFLEGSLTFFFAGRSVIGDVSHVTFFVVTVVAFNGTIVHRFFNLNETKKINDITMSFSKLRMFS